MGSDGEIVLDLIVNNEQALTSVDEFIGHLTETIDVIRRMRDGFASVEMAVKSAASAMGGVATTAQQTWQDVVRERRETKDGQRTAPQAIQTGSGVDGARTRDGRTIREARQTDQVVRGLITGINTETEQLSARLRQAATNAAKRMIDATERALQAELNQASVGAAIRQARYGSAEAANLRLRAAVISEGRLQSRIGDAQTYDDIVRREAAASLERQRQRAQAAQVAAEYAAQQRANTPRLRIRDEANAARDAEIGDKTLAEVQAMDAARRAAQRARAYQERQVSQASGNLQGGLLGVIGTGLAVGGVTETMHSVIDLDDALTRFQAITKAADVAMGPFKDHLLELGATSRYATKDLVETATTLGQTGLSVKEIEQTLPAVINLATSSGATLHQSVEVLTSVLGAYNMEASQTANLANIMSGALTKTRLTIEQLSVGLQYSADIASQTGISISELTAVFGGLAQAGARSGSVMGTQIRQIIREFENPTAKLKQEMATLGITMADIDIKANGLLGVMDNLRAKGFGTAEAIRSLEARTVTTFAALQIQGQNIKRLQEELLLYSGATEGAARANSSLVARVTQLGNTVLAVADRALAPAVEGLKVFAGGIQSVLEAALRLGPVLPTIGTAITGLVVGVGTFKGLQLAQLFFNATQAMIGFGAAAETAEVATVGLSAAFGPIGLGIGVLTAVVGGLAYVASNAERAADRIDRIKGVMQDLDSRIQQTTIAGQTIDKTIDEVLAKREKLNADPLLRRDTIIEAQKQFESMGLAVKANASNIDELIDALRRLRGELAQTLPGMTSQRLLETTRLIDEMRRQIPNQEQQRSRELASAFLPGVGYSDLYQSFGQKRLRDAIATQLGPQFANIADVALNYKRLPEDDVRSGTQEGFRLLWARTEQLRTQRVTANPDQIEAIDDQLNKLNALQEALKQAQSFMSNIQSNRAAQSRLENQLGVESIQATPAYQQFLATRENLRSTFTAGINRIEGEQGVAPEQRIAEIEAAKKKALDQIAQINPQIQAEMNRLVQSGKSVEAVKEAYQALQDSLKNLTSLATSAEQNAQQILKKLRLPTLEAEKRANEAELSRLAEGARQVLDPGALDVVQNGIDSLIEQQKKIAAQILAARTGNPDDPTAQAELKEKVAASNRELDDRRQKYVDALARERTRIAERIFQAQERAFADQDREITTRISGMEAELRASSTTSERIKELRKAIDDLISQATQLVKERSNAQYQRDLETLPKGYVPTAAAPAGSVQRQIIDAATSAGRSDLVPFLLQLGQRESNYNPLSKIGTKSPQGLFQVSPDLAEGGNLADIQTQVQIAIKKLTGDTQSFIKTFGRNPTEPELYALWQQGAAGTTALMQNRNQLAVDALARAYGGDKGRAGQAITGNFPGADLGTLTAHQFLEHVENFFGSTDNTRRFAEPLLTARTRQRDQEQQRADEAAANQRAQLDREVAARGYRDLKASDSTASRRSTQEVEVLQALANNKYDSIAQSAQALTQAAQIELGRITKAAELYDKNPGRDSTPAEKDADRQATIAAATDKFVKTVLSAADTIATKGSAEDKANLDRLQKLLQSQEQHPARYSPEEIAATRQQADALQKKVNFGDALAGQEAALDFIQSLITKANELKDIDKGDLQLLTISASVRQKQIADLKTRQQQQKTLDTNQGGSAINAVQNSTQNFFTQQGLYDPTADGNKGGWTSFTTQLPHIWDQVLGSMQQSTANFFFDFTSRTETAGEAFKKLGVSILSSMGQIASQIVSNQVLKLLFGGSLGGTTATNGPSLLGLVGTFLGGLHFAQGGFVRAAGGMYNPNRDSVPVLAAPGEYILRTSAVQAVGRETLDSINALGNNRISRAAPAPASRPAATVRPFQVYVVTPDQVPPPGPDVYVHAVADNLVRGGQLKQLVKSVAGGVL